MRSSVPIINEIVTEHDLMGEYLSSPLANCVYHIGKSLCKPNEQPSVLKDVKVSVMLGQRKFSIMRLNLRNNEIGLTEADLSDKVIYLLPMANMCR